MNSDSCDNPKENADVFVVLADGLYVFEAKRISDKLERANVRFAAIRTTFRDAGVVNPSKNNWAAALTFIENGFQRSGLGVLMSIAVHPDDLEAAQLALAAAEKQNHQKREGNFWTRTKISAALLVLLIVFAAFIHSCTKW